MTKSSHFEKLVHETLHRRSIQSASFAVRVHVFLEILLTILEYEDKLGFGVDDIVQAHDVYVHELFHERDLPDGRGRGSLLGIEVDLLQGDDLIRSP